MTLKRKKKRGKKKILQHTVLLKETIVIAIAFGPLLEKEQGDKGELKMCLKMVIQ